MKKHHSEPQQDWEVEIIRSERRRKSVSAKLKGGKLVVRAPASMSEAELAPIVEKLKARIERKVRPIAESDAQLAKRAQRLNKAHFDGELEWRSIRYVKNQTTLYGSCTPANGRSASVTRSQRCLAGCATTW